MADAVTLLQELGFSEHEARAYHALLQHHPVTGYELAKVSNIPRPNIYPVLQKLEGRGAALRIAGDETVRYIPVPPQEFLKRIDGHFQAVLEQAGSALQLLAQPVAADYIWNTQGYANLLAQARTLIDAATGKLLIALWPDEARALAGELAQAEARQVPVTTLCLAACTQECGGCRGRILRNRVVEIPRARWLLLVADDQEVVAGEIPAAQAVAVVRTRQALLVKMTSWFIQHALALGVLLQSSGDCLEEQLSAETRAALNGIDPYAPGDWLDYMRQLLNTSATAADLA